MAVNQEGKAWSTTDWGKVGAVIIAVQLLMAPGPLHEEAMLLMLFGVPFVACAVAAALVDPRPVLAPCLFGGLYLFGWLGTGARVAYAYQYEVWSAMDTGACARILAAGLLSLGVLNFTSLRLRQIRTVHLER